MTLVGRTARSASFSEEEGTERHRLYHCPTWREVTDKIPEEMRKRKRQRRIGIGREEKTSYPPTGNNRRERHLSVRRWQSGKPRSWETAAEGFRDHVAWRCQAGGESVGWSMAQLDHGEEMIQMHGMYATLDFEFEEQRTIKEDRVDGLPVPSHKGCRSYHVPCG